MNNKNTPIKDRQRDHWAINNLYPCKLWRKDTADGKGPAQPCLLLWY